MIRVFRPPASRLGGWACAMVLALAIGSTMAQAAAPAVIRIGVASAGIGGQPHCGMSYVCVAPVQQVVEKEFAADGSRIDWHFFTGAGPAVNEALAAGQLDFAWQGDLPSIVARSLGLKTRLLMAAGGRLDYYIAVPAASPVKNLADLRGKTLALFKGTNVQTVGTRVLESEGLSVDDVRVVNLDPPTSLAALAAGQIDATLLSYWGFGLRDAGKIRYIYSTANHSPKLTASAALLVTQDFLTAHPDTVDRIVSAMLRAARWASDEANRQALYEVYAQSGYPVLFWKDALAGHDLRLLSDPLLDAFTVQQYRDVAATALRLGLIRRPVTVDDWFYAGPLDKALAAQGLTRYWSAYQPDGVTLVAK